MRPPSACPLPPRPQRAAVALATAAATTCVCSTTVRWAISGQALEASCRFRRPAAVRQYHKGQFAACLGSRAAGAYERSGSGHVAAAAASRKRSQPVEAPARASILAKLVELDEDEAEEEEAIVREFGDDAWSDADSQSEDILRWADEAKLRHERALHVCREVGHETVFLFEVLQHVFPPEMEVEGNKYRGTYVDCTFGRGGHSRGLLRQLAENGQVIAFDVDPNAVNMARDLESQDHRFTFLHRPFGDMLEVLAGIEVTGIIFDIGICSVQVDKKFRGFSLTDLDAVPDRPLDLRMNPSVGIPAADWLGNVSVEELAWVLREYGPDQNSPIIAERVAQSIVDFRDSTGPSTTMNMKDLAEVAGRARLRAVQREEDFEHTSRGRDHPAKLIIHALRVFMNQELVQFEKAIEDAFQILSYNGRAAVACFTVSEQVFVKNFLLKHQEPDAETAKRLSARRLAELYPLAGTSLDYSVKLLGTMTTSPVEVRVNSRARSGRLYIMEKVPRVVKQVKATPRQQNSRFKEPSQLPFGGTDPTSVQELRRLQKLRKAFPPSGLQQNEEREKATSRVTAITEDNGALATTLAKKTAKRSRAKDGD